MRWPWAKRRRPYEAALRELVTAARPVIFDVGAERGRTAAAYLRLFPGATVHAFEPVPESADAFEAAFAGDRRVTLHRVAVGAEAGTATLHVNGAPASSSLLPSHPDAGVYRPPERLRTLEVPRVTVAGFCAERGIDRVDLLKLDVQGYEYEVLRGARAMLDRQAIGVVYCEVIVTPAYAGQHALHEYLALMDGAGYGLFDTFSHRRRRGQLMQLDALFLPVEAMAARQAAP